MRIKVLPAAIAFLSVVMAATAAAGQVVRISGVTTIRYLDVRPLVEDSVLASAAFGDGLLRQTEDGQIVLCVGNDPFCRFNRSAGAEGTMPAIQDLSLSAWGFGQGIRVFARLRARTSLGGNQDLWPQANDAIEALEAYGELDRSRFRLRVGRQWKTSGLGFYNFDGVSVLVKRLWRASLEAYGGWSLVRGLNEPVTSDALAAVEPFAPDARAVLLGTQLRVHPAPGASFSALYQREIRDDRLGLYSERVAADGSLRLGATTVTGALETDLATGEVNEARLQGWFSPLQGLGINAYARHYRPYFDLWTIWGAFSAVGYDEVGAGGSWQRPGRSLALDLSVSRRWYPATGADVSFLPLERSGWRLDAGASFRPAPPWLLQAHYGRDLGFGASKGEGTARLQRDFREATYLGVSATVFDRAYEFRVDQGTVLGLGVDGSIRLGARTRAVGDLATYQHRNSGSQPSVDWSQVRASLRIDWVVGAEPGRRAPGGGEP